MAPDQFIRLGAERGAMWGIHLRSGEAAATADRSGKLCNDAGGLIWPTEGRLFAPAGRR